MRLESTCKPRKKHNVWDWNLPANCVKGWDVLPHFCFAVIVPVINIEFTGIYLLASQRTIWSAHVYDVRYQWKLQFMGNGNLKPIFFLDVGCQNWHMWIAWVTFDPIDRLNPWGFALSSFCIDFNLEKVIGRRTFYIFNLIHLYFYNLCIIMNKRNINTNYYYF